MCRFLTVQHDSPSLVRLELTACGGRLMANIRPPSGASSMAFDSVPLLRAVKMAKLMAEHLQTDVAIVDRLGIWHDWLVGWACRPAGAAAAGSSPPAAAPED